MALTGNELLIVGTISSIGSPSNYGRLTTTQEIANLASGGGGSGGYTTQTIVTTGTTVTIAAGATFVGFNSAATGAKTVTIPASAGTLKLITIQDIYGNAGTYPINVTGSTIIGTSSIYTNYSSITLLDTNSGWCSI